jgi:hypothetical protein
MSEFASLPRQTDGSPILVLTTCPILCTGSVDPVDGRCFGLRFSGLGLRTGACAGPQAQRCCAMSALPPGLSGARRKQGKGRLLAGKHARETFPATRGDGKRTRGKMVLQRSDTDWNRRRWRAGPMASSYWSQRRRRAQRGFVLDWVPAELLAQKNAHLGFRGLVCRSNGGRRLAGGGGRWGSHLQKLHEHIAHMCHCHLWNLKLKWPQKEDQVPIIWNSALSAQRLLVSYYDGGGGGSCCRWGNSVKSRAALYKPILPLPKLVLGGRTCWCDSFGGDVVDVHGSSSYVLYGIIGWFGSRRSWSCLRIWVRF